MKKYWNKNYMFILIMVVISLGIIIFTYNNYFLYNDTIVKVTSVKNKEIKNEETKEIYYEQKIKGIIKNGKDEGKVINLENHATYSGVYDDKIRVGSELFVEISKENISINNIKRDKYIVILLVLFIDLMLLIGKNKGLKTIITLFINIILSVLVIYYHQMYFHNVNLLLIFIPLSILFIIISLLLTNKKDKKTISACFSASISLILSFTISYIIMEIYKDNIPYWYISYIEALRDYESIFFINILLCGLGAIMDISITMSTSINELILKDKNISLKNLKKSGREISKDIIGTMVNVMLFTIYSNIIPMGVLCVRNNIPLREIVGSFGEIEMIRVLTSSIGIVLAIPISLYISIYVLKIKGGKK